MPAYCEGRVESGLDCAGVLFCGVSKRWRLLMICRWVRGWVSGCLWVFEFVRIWGCV